MAEFKFVCSHCGQTIQCDTGYCGSQISCPACQQSIMVPQQSESPVAPAMPSATVSAPKSPAVSKWTGVGVVAAIVILFAVITLAAWLFVAHKLPRGVPKNGLAAFWPADGTAKDIVGGNQFVLQGGARFAHGAFELNNSPGPRPRGNSSKFPPPAFEGGAYAQVQCADAETLGDGDFAIELWANFNSVPVYDMGHPQGGVFVSQDKGAFNESKWLFALGGGVLNFHINDPQRGPVFLVKAPFRPKPKLWYHIAITRRQNVFTIYVNGKAVGSETRDRAIPHSDAPLNIGEAEGFYFNGRLNDIGIYHRALTAAEIKGIFDKGGHR